MTLDAKPKRQLVYTTPSGKVLRRFTILLRLLLIITPVAVTLGLLANRHDASLFRLNPIWSDEVIYWHQAKSFAAAGFEGGYYTVLEYAAPIGNFYAWGMFTPVVYGTFAAVLGWGLSSIVLVNLGILTLCLAIFVHLTRPNILGALTLIAVLATFIPLILYAPSSMSHVLDHAAAVLLAGGFYRLLQDHERQPSRGMIVFMLMSLVLASWHRVTWSMLILPFLWIIFPKNLKGMALTLGLGTAFMISMAGFLVLTGAPFPELSAGETIPRSLAERLLAFIERFERNLSDFNAGDNIERVQRFQVVGLMMCLGLVVLVQFMVKRWRRRAIFQLRWHLLAIYALASILVFTMLFYDMRGWRDFRMLAPPLLFAFMLLSLNQWRIFVIPFTISMIFLMPYALSIYDLWTGWRLETNNRIQYQSWEPQLEAVVAYDPDADAWCNTVMHSLHYLLGPTWVLLALDGGMGLSSPLSATEYALPFKSGYLLLDDVTYESVAERLNVAVILDVPDGKLYRNLDASCPRADP